MRLNLTAPINDLGYGVAGLNILKHLVKEGVIVSYWPIGEPTVHEENDANIIRHCIQTAEMFDAECPSLRIWHQHDMAQHIGSGKRIGFPIFELDKFTDIEKHHLASLDGILVCSNWAKSIIEKEVPSMKAKIGVVPLGVDSSIFKPTDTPANKNTVFLNIGKWEIRKGHDVLIEAFNEAFNEDDDVELWMMNHNPFLTEEQEREWHYLYLNSKLGSKIKILPRVRKHSEVASVMAHADVGVFPSRAEGWNLEALEMMSMGKYVILTNYSAHTEFATQINSKLIDIDETEDAYDGIWFHGQGQWASIGDKQVKQLITSMRSLHECKASDIENGRRNKNERGIVTAKEFSWENSAKKVINYMTTTRGF
tara:strand:- start:5383 stop:6483 length:1101 start_codon:yes stop_codon:yes gene_type:complete